MPGPTLRPGSGATPGSALAQLGSGSPWLRYPTKHVAVDRHLADRRERQLSGHRRLASRRQLPQETDAYTGSLLGAVFEAVLPVGMFEPDLEHGVAGERVATTDRMTLACDIRHLSHRDLIRGLHNSIANRMR